MADRPILFSAPMVRALLEGRKTQTRRVIKPVSALDSFTMYPQYLNGVRVGSSSDPSFCDLSEFAADPSTGLYGSGAPYCPGDRLWVRETWNVADAYLAPERRKTALEIMNYEATPWGVPGKWRSPIFMPRWASRLTLIVTDVRVQRLQDISEEDAIAEGLAKLSKDSGQTWKWGVPDADGQPGSDSGGMPWHLWSADPTVAYSMLWDSLNASRGYGWEANPWICAVRFTVERRNIDAPAAHPTPQPATTTGERP